MNRVKEINLKIVHTTFLMTWLKLKILIQIELRYTKSYKNVVIYYFGHISSKNFRNNVVNLLYFIIDKINGYIEENSGNKYFTLVAADKNKGTLKKYTWLG